jgi:membrane protease YdiL (CAAX protease family)
MKAFLRLAKSPGFVLAFSLYLIGLIILSRRSEFSLTDTLLELVIFGFGFSLLAWLTTRRAKPLVVATHPTRLEMIGLVAYVLGVTIYLVFGPRWVDSWLPQEWVVSERIHFFVSLGRKLIIFVLIPFALFGPLCSYTVRDFGWQKEALGEICRSHLPVVIVVCVAILAFQFFLGGGAAPIREGKLTTQQLVLGIPLCFLWLAIEAGLVEEFFFRALIQSRLSAWFRSEVTGVALMALVFGLAHAPGFIFRHAGMIEGLGTNPSAADAIAYSIVTLSVSGIFFGIIWARTKNLFALIVIHAATDLLPNLQGFVKTWGL